MEERNGCVLLGGCLGKIVFIVVILLCLRSCVGWLGDKGKEGYQRPSAFQNTLGRYKNSSLDLRFDLPEDMSFVSTEKDREWEELTGTYEEMVAQGESGYTLVNVYDLAAIDGLQNSLGDAGVDMGDTLPLSLETTEEQMLSFMLSGIPQEFGGGWESTTPEEVSFAGKDYLSQTWRIGAETENGQTVVMYIRGYARRKDDLMIYVMVTAQGTTLDETENTLQKIVSAYRKA
jgi:hypothetical protein